MRAALDRPPTPSTPACTSLESQLNRTPYKLNAWWNKFWQGWHIVCIYTSYIDRFSLEWWSPLHSADIFLLFEVDCRFFQVKIWFQNRRMKWKRGKKASMESRVKQNSEKNKHTADSEAKKSEQTECHLANGLATTSNYHHLHHNNNNNNINNNSSDVIRSNPMNGETSGKANKVLSCEGATNSSSSVIVAANSAACDTYRRPMSAVPFSNGSISADKNDLSDLSPFAVEHLISPVTNQWFFSKVTWFVDQIRRGVSVDNIFLLSWILLIFNF